jgi:hypothetical protein
MKLGKATSFLVAGNISVACVQVTHLETRFDSDTMAMS